MCFIAGVEVDFTDLEDLPTIRRIADNAGLEISVLSIFPPSTLERLD